MTSIVPTLLRLRSSRPIRALALCLLLSAPTGATVRVEAPLDRAAWTVEASPKRCRLAQQLPGYGRAVVEARSRAGQFFYLEAPRPRLSRGHGMLVAAAPFWNPSHNGGALGAVVVSDGERPLLLEPVLTQRLLESLADGFAPALSGPLDGHSGTLTVSLLPVAFRAAYDEWRQCQAALPQGRPILRATRAAAAAANRGWSAFFAPHQAALSTEMRARLDRLAEAAKHAGANYRIVVEGHADDSFRQLLNLELSRKRADAARDYLVGAGVPHDRIECAYRGEREARKGVVNRRIDVQLVPTTSS